MAFVSMMLAHVLARRDIPCSVGILGRYAVLGFCVGMATSKYGFVCAHALWRTLLTMCVLEVRVKGMAQRYGIRSIALLSAHNGHIHHILQMPP